MDWILMDFTCCQSDRNIPNLTRRSAQDPFTGGERFGHSPQAHSLGGIDMILGLAPVWLIVEFVSMLLTDWLLGRLMMESLINYPQVRSEQSRQ